MRYPRSSYITHVIYALLLVMLVGGGLVAQAQATPPAPVATQHTVYLPLIARPGTTPGGPNSDELIDTALERGEIDEETALIYHVFATFGDPRLPAKYRGDDSQPSDREIAGELVARFNQLSPQAKATLEPFTIPPYHAGSWWDLRHNHSLAAAATIAPAALRCGQTGNADDPLWNQWHYVDSAGGAVRVWWQARYYNDEAKARNYAKVVDDIWLKLATLMRRQPLSDQGDTTSCRGGDNRLDISLVDLDHNGEAWPYASDPVATPSYILLKRSSGIGTLIHELMHSFQFAYDVAGTFAEYSWWREASASWAVHYVDSAFNYEHGYAPNFLEAPELPLEFYTLQEKQPGYAHQYGAYLFPLFQQLQTGKPDLARTSWEQFEHFTNSLAAINSLLPGGFDKQWPEFTLRNVNQPPVDDYYKTDKLPDYAKSKLKQKVELQGAPSVAYTLDGNVQHLAAHHFHFTFPDASVRSVAFENPFFRGNFPTAHVRAVYRVGTQWATEDWTRQEWVTFCRDLADERVSELYIVISNSEWNNRSHVLKPPSAPRLLANNLGCRGWKVESTELVTETGHLTLITEKVTAQATFERYRDGGPQSIREIYRAVDGTASWTHSGDEHGCSGSGQGTYPVADTGDASNEAQARLMLDQYGVYWNGGYQYDGSRRYFAMAIHQASVMERITYTCQGGQTYENTPLHFAWLNSGPATRNLMASADGKTIVGTYTEVSTLPNDYVITRDYRWKMTALPPE